jgi:hypothetical protein
MWRELIQSLEPTVQRPIEIRFVNGASEEQLAAVETEMGVALPKDLRDLLRESNGVRDQYGWRIVWEAEEISQYNREMRTLPQYKNTYMSFADMLFFADTGTGDRFAFPIIQGKVKATRVYAWTSGDDSRIEVAFSLKSYLERLLSGKINL